MRTQTVLLLFLLSATKAFSQADISNIVKRTEIIDAPYGFQTERVHQWFISDVEPPGITGPDSTLLVTALHNFRQTFVNPKGGTGFGDLDWGDGWTSPLDDIGRIAILYAVKIPKSSCLLLHVEIKENYALGPWRGVLIIVNAKDQMTGWLYSDGSANGGNPHGNISREFSFSTPGMLKITETAWGDNTRTYNFYADYKIAGGKFVLRKRKLTEGTEN